jgi:hypothetical protein
MPETVPSRGEGSKTLHKWQDELVGMRDDHPADDEIEEEHGIGGEAAPLGLRAVTQEFHRGVGRPRET